MNYQDFKKKYLWKFIEYTGIGYRCLDPVKQILQDCYQLGKIGYLWEPIYLLLDFEKKYPSFTKFLTNDKQLTPGDIVVAPRMGIMVNGKLSGHVGIFDSYWPKWSLTINVLEQNGKGGTGGKGWPGNEVRIKNYPQSTRDYFFTDKPLRAINEPKKKYDEIPGFSLDAFVEKRKGKFIDADGVGGAVCNDLIKQYCLERLGIPIFEQSNIFFRKRTFCENYGFEYIEIKDNVLPVPGDILTYDEKWANHIGICLEVELNYAGSGLTGVRSFEQNAGAGSAGTPGNECRVIFKNLSNWNGILRKK